MCYYGNHTKASKCKIDRPLKTAQKIIGLELPTIESLYNERICSKFKNIVKDTTHPLNSHYNFNRSGLRLCVPRSNRARYRESFVPDSIYLFNSEVSR
ncbi:hypothetical protein HOLleu_29429 [Holothuria leucospilota]|uniref:Uncharacterized protein n=1 Tax=Holothuria leucospilota TaxID=206669 RepID=A0A9Q1BNN5_HOLLE|nr:hypothetical protein HOLleu_29429 [Holothuria leucospilota]